MEKEFKKARAHQRYYTRDGQLVPGVTTALNILAKPALVPWANRLGLQGIEVGKYVDAKADIGTCAHYMIECHLKGEKPDLSEFSPKVVDQAENGYIKFLQWQDGKQFELLGSEMQLVSEEYGYGGTIDIYAKVNGVPTLIDIKTSGSGIWPEMKHQVSAYRQLLIENGHPVEQAAICRVGRDDDEGFEYQHVTKIDTHFELFKRCLDIYRLQKQLNGKE